MSTPPPEFPLPSRRNALIIGVGVATAAIFAFFVCFSFQRETCTYVGAEIQYTQITTTYWDGIQLSEDEWAVTRLWNATGSSELKRELPSVFSSYSAMKNYTEEIRALHATPCVVQAFDLDDYVKFTEYDMVWLSIGKLLLFIVFFLVGIGSCILIAWIVAMVFDCINHKLKQPRKSETKHRNRRNSVAHRGFVRSFLYGEWPRVKV